MARHLRGATVLLAIAIVVTGAGYPLVVTGLADLINPHGANGSLVYLNGTLVGSSLVAQNFSRPFLFWDRPSLNDYNFLNGTNAPPGSQTPALTQLINETLEYFARYGRFNVTAALPWVSPSGSGFDPDLTPGAVLVQIPRVSAAASNVTNTTITDATLLALVNSQITYAWFPGVGVAYVNVLLLDVALIEAYPALGAALGLGGA